MTNYRLLSIAPVMARFLGAVYSKQIEPILEQFVGDHQHGFRAGRSTNSLIHILETFTSAAITSKRALYVVQVDIAKAFDKVHRQALIEFVSEIIHPKAPQAARYITSMYTEDTVEVAMYKQTPGFHSTQVSVREIHSHPPSSLPSWATPSPPCSNDGRAADMDSA